MIASPSQVNAALQLPPKVLFLQSAACGLSLQKSSLGSALSLVVVDDEPPPLVVVVVVVVHWFPVQLVFLSVVVVLVVDGPPFVPGLVVVSLVVLPVSAVTFGSLPIGTQTVLPFTVPTDPLQGSCFGSSAVGAGGVHVAPVYLTS
jgi:hypothetical protein